MSNLTVLFASHWVELLVFMVSANTCVLWLFYNVKRSEELKRLHFDSVNAGIIFAISCVVCASVFPLMALPTPNLIIVSGFLVWASIEVLLCFILLQNSFKRNLAIGFIVLTSIGIFSSGVNMNAFKSSLQAPMGKTEGMALTLGDIISAIYVFLGIFLITYFYVLSYLALRRQKQKAVEKAIGFDSASLDRLAWLLPAGIALISAFAVAGADVPSLTIFTGLIGASIGFATKDVIMNVAAGWYLLWSDTFEVGDVISFDGGGYGVIKRLTHRCTVVNNRDDVNMVIPNTILLSSKIENWTHDNNEVRLKVDIGVAYGTDLDEAEACIIKAVNSCGDRILRHKPPKVLVMSAGDSAINLQLRFWINDANKGIRNISSAVLKQMIKHLDDAEISIPFPQMDISLKRTKS